MSKITLPTKRGKASKKWEDQKFFMIGPSKVGKSTFWAGADKAFFFGLEPRLGHLNIMTLPVRSWDEFSDIAGELYMAANKGAFPYDTLVVDTVDKLVDRADEYVLERINQQFKKDYGSIGEIPEGRGWFERKKLLTLALDTLALFPAALVLVGHSDLKETSGRGSIKKATTAIGGKLGIELLGWTDHVLHWEAKYVGETLRRSMRTLPSESIDAGSSAGVVPDDFELFNDNPRDPNSGMSKCFKKFRALFD